MSGAPPVRCYSYARCSTGNQKGGNTFARQAAAIEGYVRAQGWTLDESFQLKDAGRSAFKGAHTGPKAALGQFIQAAKDGLVPAGSVLVCERVNRFSRREIDEATDTLRELLALGIDVVFADTGQRYTAANRNDLGLYITFAVAAHAANAESAIKSDHVRSARQANRDAARATGKLYSLLVPSWMRVTAREYDASGKPFPVNAREATQLIPERAALVRRMFDLFLTGQGKHAIAAKFNGEKIPTWGRNGADTRRAAQWSGSYIFKCLRNPATIGTYIPNAKDKRTGKAEEPIPDYYWPVVDPDAFQRVQDMIDLRQQPGRRPALVSIVANLTHCPKCGSTMTRVNKGARSSGPRLVCVKARGQAGCDAPAIPLADVEAGLVAGADLIAQRAPFTNPALAEERDAVASQIAEKEKEIAGLVASCARFGANVPDAIVSALQIAQTNLATLNTKHTALHRDLSRSESESVSLRRERGAQALKAYSAKSADAGTVNARLREIFERIVVDYSARELELRWLYSTDALRIAY